MDPVALLQGFTSPPVQLNLGDLTLKRSGGTSGSVAPAKKFTGGDATASNPLANIPSSLSLPPAASGAATADLTSSRALLPVDLEDPATEDGAAAVPVPVEDQVGSGRLAEKQGKATMGMAKKYGAGFIWGQLNGWYKQTVFDPTASLSAERRGTISMPDIESCYGSSRNRYSMKVYTAALHSRGHPNIACQIASKGRLVLPRWFLKVRAALLAVKAPLVLESHASEGHVLPESQQHSGMSGCRTGISSLITLRSGQRRCGRLAPSGHSRTRPRCMGVPCSTQSGFRRSSRAPCKTTCQRSSASSVLLPYPSPHQRMPSEVTW